MESLSYMTATKYLSEVTDLMSRTEVSLRDGTDVGLDDAIAEMTRRLTALARAGGQVLLIGNGGSAAIVNHLQNDLCKALGLRAMTFTDPPLMTALSNDEGYACVFERPVDLWTRPGDLLIAVSSSGQSENILRGVGACQAKGGEVVTFSGFSPDNPLRRLGVLNFYVPSSAYGYVESIHGVLTHVMSDCVLGAGLDNRRSNGEVS